MPIATAARSLVDALERGWRLRHEGELDDVEFKLASPAGLVDTLDKKVTILPFRVDLDARRNVQRPPSAPGGGQRESLGLELRVLLTAWFTDPERELQVLGTCVEIMDDNTVLEGPLIHPVGGAPSDVRLLVTVDAMSSEDMLRLWDALAPSYRLSIPYLVRTIRLGSRTSTDVPVDAFARGVRVGAAT